MTGALLLQYGIPAAVAVVSAVVGHMHGKRTASKPAPAPATQAPALHLPGNLGGIATDPVVQIVLSKLFAAAQANGHAALDAAITKMMPGLTPFVPAINSVVDAVESKVAKQ